MTVADQQRILESGSRSIFSGKPIPGVAVCIGLLGNGLDYEYRFK